MKPAFLSEKDLFSWGSTNRDTSLWPNGPMPGQKSMRLAKKGSGSSFPDVGFCHFSQVIPLPPRLFTETKRGGLARFLPTLFGFGACFLTQATRKPG
jgi:hypothetical protein